MRFVLRQHDVRTFIYQVGTMLDKYLNDNVKVVNIALSGRSSIGEIGHMKVSDTETDVCGCGKCGCLEQYASATGIVRLAKKRLAADDAATTLRDLPEVTAKDIFDAAKAGDAVSLELVETLVESASFSIVHMKSSFLGKKRKWLIVSGG